MKANKHITALERKLIKLSFDNEMQDVSTKNKVLICNNCKDIWIAPKYRCDCGCTTLTETHESNRRLARNYT